MDDLRLPDNAFRVLELGQGIESVFALRCMHSRALSLLDNATPEART